MPVWYQQEGYSIPDLLKDILSTGNGTIISIVYDAFYEMAEETASSKIKYVDQIILLTFIALFW